MNGIDYLNKLFLSTSRHYYGMLVSYIIDTGMQNLRELTDKDISDMYEDRKKEEDEAEKEGGALVFTADFYKWIMETGREVCRNVTPVELMQWVEVNKLYDVKGVKKA